MKLIETFSHNLAVSNHMMDELIPDVLLGLESTTLDALVVQCEDSFSRFKLFLRLCKLVKEKHLGQLSDTPPATEVKSVVTIGGDSSLPAAVVPPKVETGLSLNVRTYVESGSLVSMYYCCLCDVWVEDPGSWDSHQKGKKHCLGQDEALLRLTCEVCRLSLLGSQQMIANIIESGKHRQLDDAVQQRHSSATSSDVNGSDASAGQCGIKTRPSKRAMTKNEFNGSIVKNNSPDQLTALEQQVTPQEQTPPLISRPPLGHSSLPALVVPPKLRSALSLNVQALASSGSIEPIYYCCLCDVRAPASATWESHLRGRAHIVKQRASEDTVYTRTCDECSLKILGSQQNIANIIKSGEHCQLDDLVQRQHSLKSLAKKIGGGFLQKGPAEEGSLLPASSDQPANISSRGLKATSSDINGLDASAGECTIKTRPSKRARTKNEFNGSIVKNNSPDQLTASEQQVTPQEQTPQQISRPPLGHELNKKLGQFFETKQQRSVGTLKQFSAFCDNCGITEFADRFEWFDYVAEQHHQDEENHVVHCQNCNTFFYGNADVIESRLSQHSSHVRCDEIMSGTNLSPQEISEPPVQNMKSSATSQRERRWRNVLENANNRLERIRDLSGADSGLRAKGSAPQSGSPDSARVPLVVPSKPLPVQPPAPATSSPTVPQQQFVRSPQVQSALLDQLLSASGQLPLAAVPSVGSSREPFQLVSRLTIAAFLVLGILSRALLQFTSLPLTLTSPFLGFASPLVLTWWNRQPPASLRPASFVGQAAVFLWSNAFLPGRLLALFACYFVTFVLAHALFELYSVAFDNDQITAPDDQPDCYFFC